MNKIDNSSLLFKTSLEVGSFTCWSELPAIDFASCKQVHSDKIIMLSDLDADQKTENIEADGVIDLEKQTPLAIQTADCLPVALCGDKGVAMIHAGWHGLHRKILQNPALKKIAPTSAFIGPHIFAKNYPVGQEFRDYFPNSGALSEKGGQLYFSQLIEAKFQLQKAWGNISIKNAEICTLEDARFHSFRRTKQKGRNWNIWIPQTLSDKL